VCMWWRGVGSRVLGAVPYHHCLQSLVICHVVGITYQHIDRWLLAEMLGDLTGKASGSFVPIWKVWGGQGLGPQPAQVDTSGLSRSSPSLGRKNGLGLGAECTLPREVPCHLFIDSINQLDTGHMAVNKAEWPRNREGGVHVPWQFMPCETARLTVTPVE
jgi:hypothetical protein